MLADGRIPAKGEFVVVVAGAGDVSDCSSSMDADRVLAILAESLPGRQAVQLASRITGLGRNELYEKMLSMRTDSKREKT